MIRPSERLKDVGEYWFSRKLEQVRQMREAGKDVVNLGIGSPDLPPSQQTLASAASALVDPKNHGYASYRSTPELRRAMSDWYTRIYGVKVDPESQVLPLLGSKEGILYLLMAFLNAGDGVLIPDPGYPAYTSVAKLLGARIVRYELREEDGWLPDLVTLDARGCKLMLVNYPHMPTGARADAGFLRELAAFARQNNLLLCNDNPYGLVLNHEAPLSLLAADPAMANCCELNSLSKSFNMAGWRVGMLLGAAPVIEAVLKVKSNVDSGMFLPVQAGAIEALTSTTPEWHAKRNAVYAERREIVWKIFDRLGFTYSKDQVGLFVWAKAPDSVPDVERRVDEILDRANVFLTPGFIFGSSGRRFARASLCAPRERLNEALSRIAQITEEPR